MNNFDAVPTIRIVLKGKPPKEFSTGRVIVGRSEKADFRIDSDEISREHLEVTITAGALWIKDLGSSNGTYIDGKRLPPKKPFRCQQLQAIRLGKKLLVNIALIMEGVQKTPPAEVKAAAAARASQAAKSSAAKPKPKPAAVPAPARKALATTAKKSSSAGQKQKIVVPEPDIGAALAGAPEEEVTGNTPVPDLMEPSEAPQEYTQLSEVSIHIDPHTSATRLEASIAELFPEEEGIEAHADEGATADADEPAADLKSEVEEEANEDDVQFEAGPPDSEAEEAVPEVQVAADAELTPTPAPRRAVPAKPRLPSPPSTVNAPTEESQSNFSVTSEPTRLQGLNLSSVEATSDNIVIEPPETTPPPAPAPERDSEEVLALTAENEKLRNEVTHLRSEVSTLGAELRAVMERNAAVPGQIEQKEQELLKLQQKIDSLHHDLEMLSKTQEDEEHKYRLWKEENQLEIKKAEVDVQTKRSQIDVEKSSLQLVLQELNSKKELYEKELSVVERTREHTVLEIDALRKRGDQLSEANHKAEEKLERFESELKALISSTEDAVAKNTESLRIIEETEKELSTLELREKNMRVDLERLKIESNNVKESTAAERKKLIDDARKLAEHEAETIRQTAREETQKQLDVLKEQTLRNLETERAQAQAEMDTMMRKLADDLKDAQKAVEEQRRTLGEELKIAEEEHEKLAKERTATLERILEDKRTVAEHDIGERMAMVRREADMRREEEERDAKHRRQSQIKEISLNLEQTLGIKIEKIFRAKGLDDAELSKILKEIKPIVESAFLPHAKDSEVTSKKLIAIDPDSTARARAFWRHFVIGGVGAVIALVVWFNFSREIRTFVASHLPGAGDNEFVQRATRELAEKTKFNPPMDYEYKGTYVDNVVYTDRYLQIKSDEATQKRWVLELNQFIISELHLDDRIIVKFFSAETNLIRKLAELRGFLNATYEKEGIARMRAEESTVVPELIQMLGDDRNYQKFRNFEHAFYLRMLKDQKFAEPASGSSKERLPPP
jgi:hypothetical protein